MNNSSIVWTIVYIIAIVAIIYLLIIRPQKKRTKAHNELLSTLADKDLRDTPCSILEDHLYATDAKADVKEVLAPRIATEMLTAESLVCRTSRTNQS